jgi:hypothetical protein
MLGYRIPRSPRTLGIHLTTTPAIGTGRSRLDFRLLAGTTAGRTITRSAGIGALSTTTTCGMAYQRKSGKMQFSTSPAAGHGSKGPAVPEPKVGNDVSGGVKTAVDSHAHGTHDHAHDHSHEGHSHAGHSHGLFHSHHEHDNAALVSALTKNDRGSRITLLGLASNVLLTALKGVAGYAMNSASLIAEAGHSFSDMGADFVTLACWKVSRREPTRAYPYGYGKFETVGTLSVSLILVVAGVGIALHSYHVRSPLKLERTMG